MSPSSPALPNALLPADLGHLPDDAALLKSMLAELLAKLRASQRLSEQLQARLDQLLRRLYGPRAERLNPNQLLLFPDSTTPPPEPTPPPLAAASEPSTATRRKGHGRQRLPKHLLRERRVHELSEAERACPCCGQPRSVIGQETSEQLDYEPATFRVIEHVRLTYCCSHCPKPRPSASATAAPSPAVAFAASESVDSASADIDMSVVVPAANPEATLGARAPTSTFTTASKTPTLWPRCLAAPGLLAHVIVSKFGDHLPLYRLEHIFGRSGVSLSRRTLCDWLANSAEVLRPLYRVMFDEVLQSAVLQTDDTPVRVQGAGADQPRHGRVWVYGGDAYHPYVLYDYTPTREQAGPQRVLRDYLGYLQADAYKGYDALYATGRIIEVGCWAHARRKFYDAQATDPERTLYALGVIRQLYLVEKHVDEQMAAQNLTREAGWWLRLQLRQEQAVPKLTRLCQWLKQQREQVLPKSPVAEAISYTLNHWTALWRYTTQGYLAIDNNAAERALRAIAVGRKNYLFFGSDVGGATAAVLYSFVQSCKRLGIEPWRYLREILTQLPTCSPERLPELLPDRWAQMQVAQARAAPPVSPDG